MRRAPMVVQRRAGYLVESSRGYFIKMNKIPRFVDGSFERLANLPSPSVILDYLISNKVESSWLSRQTDLVTAESPIAVHVRLGDFLNLPEMYDVIKPSYYSNALEILRASNSSRPIHLFSDDPELAMSFLPKGITPSKVVEQEAGVKTAEILTLMSRYPDLICANSTFSWWAGYLGFLKGTMRKSILPQRFLADPKSDPLQHLVHAGSILVSN